MELTDFIFSQIGSRYNLYSRSRRLLKKTTGRNLHGSFAAQFAIATVGFLELRVSILA
jgi:hypothetical protein